MGFYTKNGGKIGALISPTITPATGSSGVYDLVVSQTNYVPYVAAPVGYADFSTAGSYTYVIPLGVESISIALLGGGGGGGSSGSGTSPEAGGNTTVTYAGMILTAGAGAAGFVNGSAGALGALGGTATYSGLIAGATVQTASAARAPTRINNWVACGGGGAARLDGATNAGGAEFSWGGEGGTGTTLLSYPGIGSAGGAGSNVGEAKGGDGGAYGAGGGGGRDGMGGGGGGLVYATFPVTPGQEVLIVVGAGGLGENYYNNTRRGGHGSNGYVRIIYGDGRFYPSTGIGNI